MQCTVSKNYEKSPYDLDLYEKVIAQVHDTS